MLKIRLQRVGRKHEPVFRVVVTDSHSGPKAGKSVEVVGSYDPRFNKVDVKEDRVKYWIGNGAQVSPTVHNMLVGKKVVSGQKINVLPKKTAPKKEEVVAEEATPTPATEPPVETVTPAEAVAESGEEATPVVEAESEVTSLPEEVAQPESEEVK